LQEAGKSQHGKTPHSAWSNYDDLNEYFWSVHCYIFLNAYQHLFHIFHNKSHSISQDAWLFLTGVAYAGWWWFFQICAWFEACNHGTKLISAFCNYFLLNKLIKDCFLTKHYLQAGSSPQKVSTKSTGKTNFVETRTFWHIFRSFDRMWTFYILALQVSSSIGYFLSWL